MRKIPAFLTVALLPAAAAAQTASSVSVGSPNVISSEQLRQTELEGLSAWKIIDRIRPQWLRTRGNLSVDTLLVSVARVVVDGVPFGELYELRSLRGSEIDQICYLNSSDATVRLGTGYGAGAILVVTRMMLGGDRGPRITAERTGVGATPRSFTSRPGERVRVTATGSWTGVLQASGPDSISFLVDGSSERLSIGWASVEQLEVSAGRKSRWKGALVGAGVGGAVGFEGGLVFDEGGLSNCRSLNPTCDSVSGWRLAGYAGAGMLAGGVVGALVHRGERWRAAVIPAQFGFAVTGGGLTAVTLMIPYGG